MEQVPVSSSTNCVTDSSPQPTCSRVLLMPWAHGPSPCWGHHGVSPKAAFLRWRSGIPRAAGQCDPPEHMVPNQCPTSLILGIACCRQGSLLVLLGGATAQPGSLAWGPSPGASWLEKGSGCLCLHYDFINMAVWNNLVSAATGFGSLVREDSGWAAICPCRTF